MRPATSATTLLYHDIFVARPSESGFPGAGADRYKLSSARFALHLAAISAAQPLPATSILGRSASATFHLAFDDGGSSSLAVADALEARGWIGHFFVATDYVGKPAFLDAAGVRALHSRGHIVGSHTCSHPSAMADLPADAIAREWGESGARLADLIGAPIVTGSIPCGSYTRRVAEAAGEAGITHLFTSEPTATSWRIGPVELLGRYSIVATTRPEQAAALARGEPLAATAQLIGWNAKRAVRRTVGPLWHVAREHLLTSRRPQ
ncbi:MAG: polysaccharide deacetylase family protein [Hyphomicrobiaceae bacterium]|nr:polysaccharide deacetylase family protein [Hyphomicrobiaceae bacterium]